MKINLLCRICGNSFECVYNKKRQVKPSNLIKSIMDNNNLKYDADVDFCNKNGYQYRIITEKELPV